MLIVMAHFLIPQLLKQAAEYKMQVKVMKEQEVNMKTQVWTPGITGYISPVSLPLQRRLMFFLPISFSA